MDGLLGWRATWLAALGAGLSAAQQGVATIASIEAARGQGDFHPEFFVVMALNTLATAVWCGYFVALYRAQRGLQSPTSFRRNTLITLVVVSGIRTFLLGVEVVSSMFLDTPGILTVAIGALAIVLWILVLVMLGYGRLREHAELIATPLMAITVLQSIGTIGVLLRLQPSLVAVITFIYVATQVLFLVALKNDPEGMSPGRR